MIGNLIFNTALVLSLCTIYTLVNSIEKLSDRVKNIILGFLFGGIVCISMAFSYEYAPGIFFDARIVILSLSGLCCGFITAIITMIISAVYRIIIGGQGMWAGLAAIILTTGVGLVFHNICKNRRKILSILNLFLFGIIVSLVAIFSQVLIIPISTGWETIKFTWFPFITLFPAAILLGGLLILHENQLAESFREIKSSKNRLDAITNASMDAIIMLDSDGKVVFWNKSATKIFGYTMDEIYGKYIHSMVSPKQFMGRFEEELPEFKKKGVSPSLNKIHEMKAVRKDGKEIEVELSISSVFLNDKWHAIGIVRDVTKRKKLENQIRKSEGKYRLIFENVPLGIVYFNKNGVITECNEKALKILGADRNRLIGFNLLKTNKKDIVNIVNSVLSGKASINDLEYKANENSIPIQLRVFSNPIYLSDNDVQSGICIFEDISEIKRVEAERERLERQLQRGHRLESLGRLASGIAHDFNNILSIILGNASLLRLRKDISKDVKRKLEIIEKTAQRGASLVRQLLTFARKDELEFESVNINQVIGDISKVLIETFPKNLKTKFIPDENIPKTLANENQIRQVIMNLCVNARDAMKNGGTIKIRTSLVVKENIVSRFPDAKKVDHIKIEIEDSGIGIKMEHIEHIFDPFFTTKEPEKGTGLGLSIVYSIIRNHNGFIEVQSEENKGTTFMIYLPILSETVEKHEEVVDEIDTIPGGNETILIIEDEEGILEMEASVLSLKGYKVHKQTDGMEAIRYYEKNKEEIDLVITDMGIPGMTGDKVFHNLREINPDIKVIIVSGFIDPNIKSELIKSGLAGFIQKPYSLNELVRKIRDILNEH